METKLSKHATLSESMFGGGNTGIDGDNDNQTEDDPRLLHISFFFFVKCKVCLRIKNSDGCVKLKQKKHQKNTTKQTKKI